MIMFNKNYIECWKYVANKISILSDIGSKKKHSISTSYKIIVEAFGYIREIGQIISERKMR